jgi:hypothetical protein
VVCEGSTKDGSQPILSGRGVLQQLFHSRTFLCQQEKYWHGVKQELVLNLKAEYWKDGPTAGRPNASSEDGAGGTTVALSPSMEAWRCFAGITILLGSLRSMRRAHRSG